MKLIYTEQTAGTVVLAIIAVAMILSLAYAMYKSRPAKK